MNINRTIALHIYRLKAINSLQRVSENIQLREDQLETILGALEVSQTSGIL